MSFRQALNDIAEFVQQMNQKHNFTGPWISFGCSYAGSLATWVRSKFPHLIRGSIADSAPLLAADVNLYQTKSIGLIFEYHPWLYQTCSEFGWLGKNLNVSNHWQFFLFNKSYVTSHFNIRH